MAQAFVKIGNVMVNQYEVEEVAGEESAKGTVLTITYKSGRTTRVTLPAKTVKLESVLITLNKVGDQLNWR